MCGRYAASANPEELVEEFDIESDETGGQLEPDYNVAPTKQAPVIVTRVPRGQRHEGAEPVRQLRLLTWGLVPSWSKDGKGGAKRINARAEDLLDKAPFRRAAVTRRAIVPADGWFEWERTEGKPPAGGKQPFYVTRRDGARVALAGIYEFWRDSAKEPDDPDAWLTTFAVLTTQAEAGLAHLHDRMPVVLEPEQWQDWLDPAVTEPEQVRAMLAQAEPGRFQAVPVSKLVNNADNNGADLLRPLDVAELAAGERLDATTGEVVEETLPGF